MFPMEMIEEWIIIRSIIINRTTVMVQKIEKGVAATRPPTYSYPIIITTLVLAVV